MSALQSNLTRLQAEDLGGLDSESPLWKNVLAGLATATAAIWV